MQLMKTYVFALIMYYRLLRKKYYVVVSDK